MENIGKEGNHERERRQRKFKKINRHNCSDVHIKLEVDAEDKEAQSGEGAAVHIYNVQVVYV